ncbi:hypothetical protein LTR04_001477 [Oleoguttula sp. CCFEE 6159]|nr:hypothetical protein LTR04_001477 [Oleoguttula sp. CCFEE 6159]
MPSSWRRWLGVLVKKPTPSSLGEEETSFTSVESEPEQDIPSNNDLHATTVQQPTPANEDNNGNATNEATQAIAGLGGLSLDDRLGKMSLTLSNSVSKEALTDARDGFFTELLSRKVKVTTNNKEEMKGFDLDKVTEITGFFFGQMMGVAAYGRLKNLVAAYSTPDDEGADKGVANRVASEFKPTLGLGYRSKLTSSFV